MGGSITPPVDGRGSVTQFALELYARNRVPEACLYLQTRHDLDVPVVLFAAFVGAVRRQALTDSAINAARGRVDAWHREVVRPLRAVRQRLKTGPAPAPNAITGRLRSEVQRIEIDAELVELDELDALIPELELMPASGSAAECARAAIESVVHAYALAPLDDRDLEAIDTIAGAASGSDD